jgi:hypothetical protein
MTRQRSPLFQALSDAAPPVVKEQLKTAALAKALAASGAASPGAPSAPAWTPGQPWNPAAPMAGGSV